MNRSRNAMYSAMFSQSISAISLDTNAFLVRHIIRQLMLLLVTIRGFINSKSFFIFIVHISEWEETIELYIFKGPSRYHCTEQACGFESVNKCNVVSHVQSKHLPGFPGYQCHPCQKHLQTLNSFVRHNQRFHKQ